MTSRLLTMACAVAVASSTLAGGTPVAQADDDSFFAAGRAIGLPLSLDNMVQSGRSICNFLRRGRNIIEVTNRTQRYIVAINPTQVQDFVALSVHEYCPQFSQLVGP